MINKSPRALIRGPIPGQFPRNRTRGIKWSVLERAPNTADDSAVETQPYIVSNASGGAPVLVLLSGQSSVRFLEDGITVRVTDDGRTRVVNSNLYL